MTTLRLDRKLYTKAAVTTTVEAFAGLARIQVTADERYHVVELADPDPDVAETIDKEFANFALAETIEGRR